MSLHKDGSDSWSFGHQAWWCVLINTNAFEKLNLKSIIGLGLGVLLILILASPALAQFSDNIDISLETDQEGITVGDPIRLHLVVTHPAGYEVAIPALETNWGDFEVWSQSVPEVSQNEDGSETTSQIIEAAVFAPGVFQTPSLNISLLDPNGQVLERVVPQASIEVVSVLSEPEPELRDIKPQADLPFPPLWPWILLATLLALGFALILIWFILYLRKRLKKPKPEPVPVPVFDPRSPYEIAMDELNRIEALDLPGQGRFKEYYTLVTTCLRAYIGSEFRFPALDYTTAETGQTLRTLKVESKDTQGIIEILTEGDLVKFARFTPDFEESRSLINRTRVLVELVSYEPEPEPIETSSESDFGPESASENGADGVLVDQVDDSLMQSFEDPDNTSGQSTQDR